jgi:hypothetical protein
MAGRVAFDLDEFEESLKKVDAVRVGGVSARCCMD